MKAIPRMNFKLKLSMDFLNEFLHCNGSTMKNNGKGA